MIKSEAPILFFLHYRFDNRRFWFCTLWRASYPLHGGISSFVQGLKSIMTGPLTALVYWLLAWLSGDWRKSQA